MSHAASSSTAGDHTCRCSTPCAMETRSTFRPTRAIQSFCCQRWAPVPRGIIAAGSEPAFDDEPTRSPRRAHSGGPSSQPKPPERRTCDAPSLSPRSSSAWSLPASCQESSRPPCGETERRPDSSAPSTDALRVDSPHRAFAPFEPALTHIGLCNPHDPRSHLARFAPTRRRCLPATPLTPVRVRNSNSRCCRQMG
jgi:hypothetical protein